MTSRAFRNGSALITCTIMLVVVSALAVSLAAISGNNLQIAGNQQEANRAFANAESGLEVMRYWLARVRIPSSTPPAEYLSNLISLVQSDLQECAVANFRVQDDGSIPVVMLDTTTGENFRGHWSSNPSDPKIVRATVTGTSRTISRTITVNFSIEPYHFPIFNYGMAMKGPLVSPGNPKFLAATQGWEADIYIESANSLLAVDVDGNAQFEGDIDIGNPAADVSFGSLNIDGQINKLEQEDCPEFPRPDVEHFLQYATGPLITSDTDLSAASMTFANARVAPGTNPTFEGNVTIQGILYIEAPNYVIFTNNVTVLGMIVAAGADVNNPGNNQINFGDPDDTSKTPTNFSSGPYPDGAQFDPMRDEVGSLILAPGFEVSFWKNFSALNGVIAASGLYFDKNASATVSGTLINYSDEPTIINGNVAFTFDRSAMVEIPAGFDLLRVLQYDPASYALAF